MRKMSGTREGCRWEDGLCRLCGTALSPPVFVLSRLSRWLMRNPEPCTQIRKMPAGQAANMAVHSAIKKKGLDDDITVVVVGEAEGRGREGGGTARGEGGEGWVQMEEVIPFPLLTHQ